MIKHLLIPLLLSATLFGNSYIKKTHKPATHNQGQSKMQQMQQKHPDRLPDGQRHVMFMLSPTYQRIYLYVLNDDQREMVAVFERRGENPYNAIDNILSRDRNISDPTLRDKCRPSERTKKACQQKRYIISEEQSGEYSDDDVLAGNTDDFELYEEEAPKKRSGFSEKPNYSSANQQYPKHSKALSRKDAYTQDLKESKAAAKSTSYKSQAQKPKEFKCRGKKKYKYVETYKKKCCGSCKKKSCKSCNKN